MKYTEFKNAYLLELKLKSKLSPIQKTLFAIQRKFDDYYLDFFLDTNYSSALLYNNLLGNFTNLIENSKLDKNEVLSAALSIYKDLVIKNILIDHSPKNKLRDINNNNGFLSHTA